MLRVYVKGAPEYVILLCNSVLERNGNIAGLSESGQKVIIDNIVANEMACLGLKVLSFGYKDIERHEYEEILENETNLESSSLRVSMEEDLTYICTFGLQDDLRSEANEAIMMLKYGSNTTIVDNQGEVNVRILTGDHIETAKQVALRSGIIMQEDINQEGIAITGEDFHQTIGNITK